MKKIISLTIFNFSFLLFNCFAQQSGWEIVPSGTTEELNSIFFYDYEVGFACGNSGTVIKSIDSGKTWQTIQTPVTNDLNDLYVFNDSTLCVVGDSGTIIFSFEGGNNWYVGSYFLTEDYYSIYFSEANGILGGSSQTIVRAEFEATSITFYGVQSGFFGGGFWGAYMLSPQIGFVAGENSIFQPLFGRSTYSGINWVFTAFYLNNNEGRATGVDFTDMNTGYVSASVWDGTGAIAKTTNSGLDWTSTMFSNPLWSVDFPISGASQIGYAVGSQGTILKTYNAGANWQQQISGTTSSLNKVFFKDFDFGFAVGENGIIFRTTTGGEPVTIVEHENQSPHSFELFQNYPNPFNPSTKIKFTIPSVIASGAKQSQLVTLKVYDVLGNEIATLVNEELPAGEYEVEFNTNSVEGRNLTSGVYFYQLKIGGPVRKDSFGEINSPNGQAGQGFIQTRKMVLLK
jgi:photosystem II stability/assembly factor-like uncharacterized protein